MVLTGITWITTYNCNLECEHCFFETKGTKKYMDPELVDMALRSLKNTKHMFWQHLSGGEIFLDEDRLIKIIENIRKYFKKDLGLSTNAFWAATEEIAENKLSKLVKAGVTGVAVSADHYHQKNLNIERPSNLAKAIKKSGLKTHSYVMGARLKEDVANAETINSNSEKIARQVEQGLGIPYARAMERSIGKGCLLNVPKAKEIPQGMCTELNTCLGERTPFNPAMVWIDPYGNVMICYGVIIGNLYEKSLNNIIENYDPGKNKILQCLGGEGPKGIYKYAFEQGFDLPKAYYDECDLCYQSRSALQHKHPDLFGPKECYPV